MDGVGASLSAFYKVESKVCSLTQLMERQGQHDQEELV